MDSAKSEFSSRVLQTCTLGVHDDGFSLQDALVSESLLSSWNIAFGTLLQIRSVPRDNSRKGISGNKSAHKDNDRKNRACKDHLPP